MKINVEAAMRRLEEAANQTYEQALQHPGESREALTASRRYDTAIMPLMRVVFERYDDGADAEAIGLAATMANVIMMLQDVWSPVDFVSLFEEMLDSLKNGECETSDIRLEMSRHDH